MKPCTQEEQKTLEDIERWLIEKGYPKSVAAAEAERQMRQARETEKAEAALLNIALAGVEANTKHLAPDSKEHMVGDGPRKPRDIAKEKKGRAGQ